MLVACSLLLLRNGAVVPLILFPIALTLTASEVKIPAVGVPVITLFAIMALPWLTSMPSTI